MEMIFPLLGFLVIGLIFYNIFRSIYSLWDHTGWNEPNDPDPNAKITDIKSEEVQYIKNGAKFKTTVTFSDGFYFMTHKTRRENYFMRYRIWVDKEAIVTAAIAAHSKAVTARGGGKAKAVPAPAPQPPAPKPAPAPAPQPPAPKPAPAPVPQPLAPKPAPTPAPHPPAPNPPVQKQRKGTSVLLRLTGGPMAGTKFRCREGKPVIVGRDPSRSHLVLKDYGAISGVHCRLEVTSRGLAVTDMGSTNGTFVNDIRLTPNQPVSAGDGAKIRLANQQCVFDVKYE